jgi:hypothetical protein
MMMMMTTTQSIWNVHVVSCVAHIHSATEREGVDKIVILF